MDWRPDVLGGFEQLPLPLRVDDEGAVVATLVRPTGRRAIASLVALGAKLGPRAALPGIDRGFNTQASSRLFDGEWDYDLRWRPERGFPVHSG